jgi:DNA-binding response OmpR family regulator
MVMGANEMTPAAAEKTSILVIEPDVIVRMAVATYLRDCGYKVIEGVNSDDALAVLSVAGQKIDVMLCEVALDGVMDGFALARWARERYPDIDVILVSGTRGAAAKAAGLCDDGPLEKPYHPRELIRRINTLSERRRTNSTLSGQIQHWMGEAPSAN